ncbi:MAG: HAD family hydrolase [Pseudomonadota bacterium]
MTRIYEKPLRIALWSGPRNLSTAMMRSFAARDDTICVDEPFYAPYLALTGLDHPMRDAILREHESDPGKVIHRLAHAPATRPIFYQKQMTHHMVDDIDRGWMGEVHHAFLIRHPARVMASYARKMETASLEAIGFPQQYELFHHVTGELGQPAIVIDSDDILHNPASMLQKLCTALEIDYQPTMLNWSSGVQPEDGIWASHWYDSIIQTTGFGAPPGDLPQLEGDYATIAEAALASYAPLWEQRLR